MELDEMWKNIHISVIFKKGKRLLFYQPYIKIKKIQIFSGHVSAQISACFHQFWSSHAKAQRLEVKTENVGGSDVY